MNRRWCALALVGVVLLAACAGKSFEVLPPPPTTIALPTTTTAADLTMVAIRSVGGRKIQTVRLGPGPATINGVVSGPNGAVAGATVHIERLVGDGVGTVDLLTNPDGTFSLPAILGGRYRVRAYKPAPDNLALVKPEVFFLVGADVHQSTLNLDLYAGLNAAAAIAPNPPVVGDPTNVVVQVTQRSVDNRGIVRAVPIPNVSLELFATGQWRVKSQNLQQSDANGRAQWEAQCGAGGQQPLSVVVNNTDSFVVYNGACTDALPPPSTEPTSTTSTTGITPSSSTTSTTVPRRTTTTGA